MNMIHTNSSGVGSKSFVQPKITPPFHGNKVTEPLETASNKKKCKNVLEGAAINNVQGRQAGQFDMIQRTNSRSNSLR